MRVLQRKKSAVVPRKKPSAGPKKRSVFLLSGRLLLGAKSRRRADALPMKRRAAS
jgi:hypothetical protein